MKKNPQMFRCKLAKMIDGAMVMVTYIGPYDRIPPGWSMFMKRIIGPSGGMAA